MSSDISFLQDTGRRKLRVMQMAAMVAVGRRHVSGVDSMSTTSDRNVFMYVLGKSFCCSSRSWRRFWSCCSCDDDDEEGVGEFRRRCCSSTAVDVGCGCCCDCCGCGCGCTSTNRTSSLAKYRRLLVFQGQLVENRLAICRIHFSKILMLSGMNGGDRISARTSFKDAALIASDVPAKQAAIASISSLALYVVCVCFSEIFVCWMMTKQHKMTYSSRVKLEML